MQYNEESAIWQALFIREKPNFNDHESVIFVRTFHHIILSIKLINESNKVNRKKREPAVSGLIMFRSITVSSFTCGNCFVSGKTQMVIAKI
jgi:hypothetical protein